MFCLNCGKELPEGTAFCGSCGQKVGDTISISTPPDQQQSDILNINFPAVYYPKFGRSLIGTLTITAQGLEFRPRLLGIIRLPKKLTSVHLYRDIERVEAGATFGNIHAIIVYTEKEKCKYVFNLNMEKKIPTIVDFINKQL